MEVRTYEEMNTSEDTFWWHVGMKKISKVLLDLYVFDDTKKEILDVGCGTGHMFALLGQYGKVTGIDVSPDAVRYAKEKNIALVVQASADKLPFDNQTFDILVCHDVLYHRLVFFDDTVLTECYRVLKPGGTILFREPAFDWLRGYHDTVVWTRHRYAVGELRTKMVRHGFDTVKISYANFFLFPIALLIRLVSRRQKIVEPRKLFMVYPFLNTICKQLLFLEARLLTRLNFPFGLSVIGVAKKRK